MVELSPTGRTRRSIIEELLQLCVDNHLISDADAAVMLNIAPRTVRLLRASDSFKTVLSRRIEQQHGDAIRAVRNNTLVAANTALETTTKLLKDPAALPSTKLEAAKIALENHHRAEERSAPRLPQGHQGTNVTVNLTFEELRDAQQSALRHGKSIDLEPSDVAHSAQVSPPRHGFLTSGLPSGSAVREKG